MEPQPLPENIGADDEKTVGIDRFARADHVVPPAGAVRRSPETAGHMGVAGKGMEDEHRIAAFGVQLPQGFIGKGDRPQAGAAI